MSETSHLQELGLTESISAHIAGHDPALTPGRVIRSDRGFVFVMTDAGIVMARPAMRLVKQAEDGALPVAGDWVLMGGGEGEPLVEAVLPRSTAIVRRDPGKAARVQVLAANVDLVFIAHSMEEGSPNLSRLERELALVWDSGATPVLVFTKSDLCADIPSFVLDAEPVTTGVDFEVTSAESAEGLEGLAARLRPGTTVAIIGPSGSGKSTLVNSLAGEDIRKTSEVRVSDHRGRHTTVSRELISLPGGGLIIDTPGLRAVGMWDSSDGLMQAFADIAELAVHCRFRDCKHDGEPGCAVEAAVEAGELPARRLESYRELQAEIAHVNDQLDMRARQERKREDKLLARAIKRYYKDR